MKTPLPAILVVSVFPLFVPNADAQEGSSMILGRGQRSSVTVSPTPGYQLAVAQHAQPSARFSGSTESAVGETESESSVAFPSLSPAAAHEGADAGAGGRAQAGRLTGPAITVTSSLAVVLGLFAALIWLTRKFGGRSGAQGTIPKDAIQNLGSTSIDPRTQVTLLRCGQRIMVMARTNTGIYPLSEITNPEEVSQLTAACLGDSKQAFASALQSIETEPSGPGYLGDQPSDRDARAHGRLFATA